MSFRLTDALIAEANAPHAEALADDYDHLGNQLARRGIVIEALTRHAMQFRVAVPCWGFTTGGTGFAR